jgi:hypothetical protein
MATKNLEKSAALEQRKDWTLHNQNETKRKSGTTKDTAYVK